MAKAAEGEGAATVAAAGKGEEGEEEEDDDEASKVAGVKNHLSSKGAPLISYGGSNISPPKAKERESPNEKGKVRCFQYPLMQISF